MENKYNELEKLNQLKASGTITNAEFEMQKQKILNNKSKKTNTKKKSKLLKGIIALVSLIIIIVVGIIVKKPISNNIIIKDTENKISQINAKELETELINSLKNTSLNVNTSRYKTEFEICNKNSNKQLSLTMSVTAGFYGPSEDYFENFVCAVISDTNNSNSNFGIVFPCFRITSDNSGKVRNIEYISYDNLGISDNVHETMNSVLKNKYGIKKDIISVNDIRIKQKYEYHFRKSQFVGFDDIEPIISLITKETDKSDIKEKLQSENGKDITIFVWNNN